MVPLLARVNVGKIVSVGWSCLGIAIVGMCAAERQDPAGHDSNRWLGRLTGVSQVSGCRGWNERVAAAIPQAVDPEDGRFYSPSW